MKKKSFLILPLLFIFASCGSSSPEEIDPIDNLLKEASKGLTVDITSTEIVKNYFTEEEMYRNTTRYHYIFDDSNGAKTTQELTFKYAGENQNIQITVVKDEDGFICQEYVNYKNELSKSYVFGDDGYAKYYDEYYLNPFKILRKSDFTKLENENTYFINYNKINLMDYYLTGKSEPCKEMKLSFEKVDGKFKYSMTSLSQEMIGRSLNYVNGEPTKEYVRAKWHCEDVIELSNIGSSIIKSPELSQKKDNQDELKNIFSKVNDNFTLEASLTYIDENNEKKDILVKESYFDSEKYYVVNDKSKPDLKNNYLYQKDMFMGDEFLYRYYYNEETQKWVKEPNTIETSYNIDPHEKDYFVPNIKDISPDLFSSKNENGKYEVENNFAKSFIGNGFLSEIESVVFFEYGYGYGASLSYDEANESVKVEIPFYYDGNDYLYELNYYNIGKTVLPITL